MSRGACRICRQPGAASLCAGALSPDENARPDAAGDRQRWMGKRGDRHHRNSRLRSTIRQGASRAIRLRRYTAACSNGSSRPAGCFRSANQRKDQPIMITEFGGIAYSRDVPQRGDTRARKMRKTWRTAISICCGPCGPSLSSPASAIHSSPILIRRQMDCCMPTERPKFPWNPLHSRRVARRRRTIATVKRNGGSV